MRDEYKEWFELILHELRRNDQSYRDINKCLCAMKDEIYDQGKTLVRNTKTVEEHVSSGLATNKRLTIVEERVFKLDESIKKEIRTLNVHIAKIDTIMTILTPTKAKLKWLVFLLSLFGGSYGGYKLTLGTNMDALLKLFEGLLK